MAAIMAHILLPASVMTILQRWLHVVCRDLRAAQKHSLEQVLSL